MKDARGLLEFAKAAGFADIIPGVRLATREFLRGRLKRLPAVVEVSPGHKVEFFKGVSFETAPFWFFVEPEAGDDRVMFYSAPDEQNTLVTIEASIHAGNVI
ncbi:MAG: hypothetical protein LBJ24_01660 [Treponema sp.]|jgi:hypothetical protein|nr:hypothetical protein [Treponema sp.]